MGYFMVRLGREYKYAEVSLKNGFVAIGWEIPDLRTVAEDKLADVIGDIYPDKTKSQISTSIGQIMKFYSGMIPGDYVLSPFGNGEYRIGKVDGYYFEESPKDGCPYKHRRNIRWFDTILHKEDMSTNLFFSMGSLLTVFSLNKYAKEIETLRVNEPRTPGERPTSIRSCVLEDLLRFEPKEFEEFVTHLLSLIGYDADVTSFLKDEGVDIIATLSAAGLPDIKLLVQVKRYALDNTIGSPVIQQLKGALAFDEQGCVVTTSRFSKPAIKEADREKHKTIKLINGDELAGLVLKNYDGLDEKYKNHFSVKKRTDTKIEELFEIIPEDIGNKVNVNQEIVIEKNEDYDFDTIVCPAREDGFEVFFNDKAWWAVKISEVKLNLIKYIAIYQSAPISSITCYGEVDRIEELNDTGKYKIFLKGNPKKLETEIGIGLNKYLRVQSPRYTKIDKILKATTLDDVFN